MTDYEKIVSEFKTPLYLFDTDVLSKRVEYLNGRFSDNTALVYAVKANTFIPREIESDVARFEICSKGEFDICNKLGIDRGKMVISGVHKDRPSIEEMISLYDDVLKYTVESIGQYELLKELSAKYGRTTTSRHPSEISASIFTYASSPMQSRKNWFRIHFTNEPPVP